MRPPSRSRFSLLDLAPTAGDVVGNARNIGRAVHAAATQGAEMLISPANWRPGASAPNGEWEERSRQNELPLIVCNRTARDSGLDFSCAESLVILGGQRRPVHKSDHPVVLTSDWNHRSPQTACAEFLITAF